jgi:hypothetical protein
LQLDLAVSELDSAPAKVDLVHVEVYSVEEDLESVAAELLLVLRCHLTGASGGLREHASEELTVRRITRVVVEIKR